MKIREENCNMVLLAAVTLLSLMIASGATVVGSPANSAAAPDRTTVSVEETSARLHPAAPDKSLVYVNDRPQVRVVGAPFVPNTNPSER